jgi:hypothetical protein
MVFWDELQTYACFPFSNCATNFKRLSLALASAKFLQNGLHIVSDLKVLVICSFHACGRKKESFSILQFPFGIRFHESELESF